MTPKTPTNARKFIRRSILLDQDDYDLLKKVRIKRVYLKQICDLERDGFTPVDTLNRRRYLKGKVLNFLEVVQSFSMRRLSWLHELRNARNLQTLWLELGKKDIQAIKAYADRDAKINHILSGIKRISKNVKTVKTLIQSFSVKKGHVTKLYRNLASFRKLATFKRILGFARAESYVEHEYKLINKYLARYPALKHFGYRYFRYDKKCWANTERISFANHSILDQRDFLLVLNKNIPCPWINELHLTIKGEYLLNFDLLRHKLTEEVNPDYAPPISEDEANFMFEEEEEDSLNDENEEEEEKDLETTDLELQNKLENEYRNKLQNEYSVLDATVIQNDDNNTQLHNQLSTQEQFQVRSEISHFFKFHLFQNLKELTIELEDDFLFPLGSYLPENFKSLQNLEQLHLSMAHRILGIEFLLQGILNLPLIKDFSLSLPYTIDKDWQYLSEFFEKQTHLVFLKLILTSRNLFYQGFLRQNKQLEENLHKMLENKPDLRYFMLKSSLVPLRIISKALGQIKIPNHLRQLNIHAFDDAPLTSGDFYSNVDGLCEFLATQKDSLYFLNIMLSHVANAAIVQYIARKISQLEQLRTLDFSINFTAKRTKKQYINFFEKSLKRQDLADIYKHKKRLPDTYYTEIAETLEKLISLEELKLDLGVIEQPPLQSIQDFITLIETLSSVPALNIIEINYPFKIISEATKTKIKQELEKLQQITFIHIGVDDVKDEDDIQQMADFLNKINSRQILRQDLMFY